MKKQNILKEEVLRRIRETFPGQQARSRYELTPSELAEYLQALRVAAGISRQEMAAYLDIPPETLQRLEDPDVAESLSPAERHLQDLILTIFGGRRLQPRIPYYLPPGADIARDRLQRLKQMKKNWPRENVEANFQIGPHNFYDEL